MTAIRRVRLPAGVRFDDYTDYQSNYVNYRTGWLIPSTEVWIGTQLATTINSLGCKGPEPTPGVPVIGVFGDSTVFGAGVDSWPFHIQLPGYQPLNCGIEGHDLARLVQRYEQIKKVVDLAAVVVGSSWHNLVYNRTDEDYWASTLDQFEDDRPVAVATLSTAYVPASCEIGLDDAIAATYPNNRRFVAWGGWPTTPEKTRQIYDAVLRYNDFVRAYCERTDRILVDFYELYRPEGYANMAEHFSDPVHQRPSLYPLFGRAVSEALSPHLDVDDTALAPSLMATLPVHDVIDNDVLLQSIYPLW
jgi:hypothetical protein